MESLIYVNQAPELLGTAFESQLQLAEQIKFNLQGSMTHRHDHFFWTLSIVQFF